MVVVYLFLLHYVIRWGFACHMHASVERVFPMDKYMGYGNMGFYRTHGVSINVQCSHLNQVNINEIMLYEGTTKIHSENTGFNYTITNLSPGAEYHCKCSTKSAGMQQSTSVFIPTISPCSMDVCSKSQHKICYQSTSAASNIVMWDYDCDKEQLDAKLLSFGWTDGLMLDLLNFNFTTTNNNHTKQIADILYSDNFTQGLCHANSAYDPVPLHGMCNLAKQLHTSGRDIPQFRSSESCLNTVQSPAGQNVLLDLFPLSFMDQTVYAGAIYIVSESNSFFDYLLKRTCASPSNRPAKMECELFVWTNPGNKTRYILPVNEHSLKCRMINWHIKPEWIGRNPGNLNMVGCTLTHIDYILSIPEVPPVPLYRQVEFFIKFVSEKIQATQVSNDQCTVKIGSEKVTGAISAGCSSCTVQLATCNPVKVEKTVTFPMVDCTTAMPTPETSHTTASRRSSKSAHTVPTTQPFPTLSSVPTESDKLYMYMGIVGAFAVLLIIFCIILYCTIFGGKTKPKPSVTSGSLMDEPMHTKNFFTDLSATTVTRGNPVNSVASARSKTARHRLQVSPVSPTSPLPKSRSTSPSEDLEESETFDYDADVKPEQDPPKYKPYF